MIDPVAREETVHTGSRSNKAAASLRRHHEKLWIGADQALSSATNFGCSALAAGLLSAADFGAFSVAFSLYVIALGVTRAWTSDVLLVTARPNDHAAHRSMIGSALAASLGVSGVAALCVLAVSPLLQGSTRVSVTVLALCLPVMLVQDTCRYGLIMLRQPTSACVSDGAWLIASVVAIMALRVTDTQSVGLATLAWGLGALPGVALGLRNIGRGSTRPSALEWLRQARPLSTRIVTEFGISLLSGFVTLIIVVSTLVDTAAAGGIRGAQVLMGPITVVFTATVLYVQPEMVRRLGDDQAVRRLAIQQSMFNGLVALAWMAMVQLVPDRVGVRVFGETWRGATDVLLFAGLAVVGAGLYTGATNEMRARHLVNAALFARVMAGALVISATVVGALSDGFMGSVKGFAIGSLASPVVCWAVLTLRSGRRSQLSATSRG